MEISWNIIKSRGNFRPVVKYKIILEENEARLGIPPLKVDSEIRKPLVSWERHCFPGKNERAGLYADENYIVITPGFKNPESTGEMIIPWKENNNYCEVENCFIKVRNRIEDEILSAKNSLPLNEKFNIGFSEEFKTKRAPSSAIDMFLKAAM